MEKTRLEIYSDLSSVIYDGREYKVCKVKRYRMNQTVTKHICSDKLKHTIRFDRCLDVNGKLYFVEFCNKCKTLSMMRAKQ